MTKVTLTEIQNIKDILPTNFEVNFTHIENSQEGNIEEFNKIEILLVGYQGPPIARFDKNEKTFSLTFAENIDLDVANTLPTIRTFKEIEITFYDNKGSWIFKDKFSEPKLIMVKPEPYTFEGIVRVTATYSPQTYNRIKRPAGE